MDSGSIYFPQDLQVPWTCSPSGSSHGLEPDLLRWTVFSFSQSLYLPVKTDAKNVIQYLSLVHILGSQVSHFLLEGVHIFPSLSLIIVIPIDASLVALNVPGQI